MVLTSLVLSVLIQGGRFAPLFGLEPQQKDLPVQTFRLDRYPVSNRDFGVFLKSHPEWGRKQRVDLFADRNYLKSFSQNKKSLDLPVVEVSWFAAQAYCEWKKGRLPTTLEWEYVAQVNDQERDEILKWYSTPQKSQPRKEVSSGKPNRWNVYNLHGLIWEWTNDFNSVFVSGDNRQDADQMKDLFCGTGALGSSNRENYAAFMRYAMRSSLKANYTLGNLGFRCAYDE